MGDQKVSAMLTWGRANFACSRQAMEPRLALTTSDSTATLLEATCSTAGNGTTPNTSGTTATENGNAESATGGN